VGQAPFLSSAVMKSNTLDGQGMRENRDAQSRARRHSLFPAADAADRRCFRLLEYERELNVAASRDAKADRKYRLAPVDHAVTHAIASGTSRVITLPTPSDDGGRPLTSTLTGGAEFLKSPLNMLGPSANGGSIGRSNHSEMRGFANSPRCWR
jgi:hypothetical protein